MRSSRSYMQRGQRLFKGRWGQVLRPYVPPRQDKEEGPDGRPTRIHRCRLCAGQEVECRVSIFFRCLWPDREVLQSPTARVRLREQRGQVYFP